METVLLALIGIFLALLWIGWELHRMVPEFREFMVGLVEGYQESAVKRQGI